MAGVETQHLVDYKALHIEFHSSKNSAKPKAPNLLLPQAEDDEDFRDQVLTQG